MHIAVCVKTVFDPEIPAAKFKIDPAVKRQNPDGLTAVVNPYDLNALEVALKLREKSGARVSLITVAHGTDTKPLRSALAMGADDAYVICDSAIDDSQTFSVARALAEGIKKIGAVNVVFAGCESADWGGGAVAPMLAEMLGMPCVTYARIVSLQNEKLQVERMNEDGVEIWEVVLPAVVSVVSNEANTPRYAKLKDVMAAAKKQIPIWSLADIGLSADDVRSDFTEIGELFVPQTDSHCEFLEGNAEEQALLLVARLRERGAI